MFLTYLRGLAALLPLTAGRTRKPSGEGSVVAHSFCSKADNSQLQLGERLHMQDAPGWPSRG